MRIRQFDEENEIKINEIVVKAKAVYLNMADEVSSYDFAIEDGVYIHMPDSNFYIPGKVGFIIRNGIVNIYIHNIVQLNINK